MLSLLLACSGEPVADAPSATPPVPSVSDKASQAIDEIRDGGLMMPPPGLNIIDRLEPLQGRWRDAADEKAEVLILNTLWVEGYDGEEKSRGVLEWADGCRADGGRPSPTGEYLNVLSEPPRCFQLGEVTEAGLVVKQFPDGSERRFVRAPVPDGM